MTASPVTAAPTTSAPTEEDCIIECPPKETDCYTGPIVTDLELNGEDVCVYSSSPVLMGGMDGETSMFEIKNTWDDLAGDVVVTVLYESQAGEDVCEQLDPLALGADTEYFAAKCGENGTALVYVYMTHPDITGSTIKGESIPDVCGSAPMPNTCLFEFILPCEPELMCSDTPSESPSLMPTDEEADCVIECPPGGPHPTCYDGPVVTDGIIDDKQCIYTSTPLMLESMDEGLVTLHLQDTWEAIAEGEATVKWSTSVEGTECFDLTTPFGDDAESFVASCNADEAVTMIYIFVTHSEISQSLEGMCGGNMENTCVYEFAVPCTPDTMCTEEPSSGPTAAPVGIPLSSLGESWRRPPCLTAMFTVIVPHTRYFCQSL